MHMKFHQFTQTSHRLYLLFGVGYPILFFEYSFALEIFLRFYRMWITTIIRLTLIFRSLYLSLRIWSAQIWLLWCWCVPRLIDDHSLLIFVPVRFYSRMSLIRWYYSFIVCSLQVVLFFFALCVDKRVTYHSCHSVTYAINYVYEAPTMTSSDRRQK